MLVLTLASMITWSTLYSRLEERERFSRSPQYDTSAFGNDIDHERFGFNDYVHDEVDHFSTVSSAVA